MERFNSVLRLQRTFAWVFRYTPWLRGKVTEPGRLTVHEILKDEVFSYQKDTRRICEGTIACTKENRQISDESPRCGVPFFLDNEGIPGVTGRLQYSISKNVMQLYYRKITTTVGSSLISHIGRCFMLVYAIPS